jgi:hypothetical protein
MERPSWKQTVRQRGSPRLLSVGVLLILALLGSGLSSRAATFSASLDRTTLSLGESATLTLKFEGASPDAPSLPSIPNLQITYVGPSSQFSFINGRTSSSITHTFTVTPRQAGDFTIPALTAVIGQERLTTQPIALKVLQPGAPPPEAINSGAQAAFIRLVLPKSDLYVGEAAVAELQLYVRDVVRGIANFQITSMPAEGLISSTKLVQGQERRTQIGNAVYRMIPLGLTLRAVKEGTTKIGPVTASVVLQLPSNNSNRRRDSLFEQFGFRDPFGFDVEQKQVVLASDPVTVHLVPLPDKDVPPNFTGAVGTYEMAASVGPTNVAVGDPITIRIQISGRGALDSIALPEQIAGDQFKAYPPTSGTETSDQFGLQGTKSFEQIVAPGSTDISELPALSFSFFDPEAGRYRTLTQPAVPLTVRPGGSTPSPQTLAGRGSGETPPPRQDIVPIRQRLGGVGQVSAPLVTQPWFLAAQAVPVAAFFAAFLWRRRSDALANNPRLRRQRHVAQVVSEGLKDLERFAAENKSDEFFATLFRLMQERLGERLDCPASAITEAAIDERLDSAGVDESTLAALRDLFQACNVARYAPVRSSQELAAFVPKAEKTLNELREVKA